MRLLLGSYRISMQTETSSATVVDLMVNLPIEQTGHTLGYLLVEILEVAFLEESWAN